MDSTINLQRWQQAFEDHPISTTRAIEKQLRSSVANDRERLRGLVGGNYRELLSTADRIVYLDGKTKATELRISEISRQCEPPGQIPKRAVASDHRSMAELSLLQACLGAARRSLVAHNILRCSRLIVISRLLLKSLQSTKSHPASLSVLRDKISTLRRRCILRIDSILISPRSKLRSVVNAGCAYCLINSASASEVFKYTQRLRLEKLKDVASTASPSSHLVEEVLQYILTTLQMLRRVFGRPLADALSNLQRRQIFQDLDLVGSDVVASNEVLLLISEDIVSFSPYFKREPVSASEATTSLESWTNDACQTFTQALQNRASQVSDVSELLALRRTFLSLILPYYFDSKAGNVLCQSIGTQVALRLTELGRVRVDHLNNIADQLARPTIPLPFVPPLWGAGLASMQLSNGSDRFLKQVHKRYHGYSAHLLNVSSSLSTWIVSMATAIDAGETAKSIRWRDILEEPNDEQEDESAQVITLLSQEEPQQILDQIKESLKTSLDGLATTMVSAIDETIEKDSGVDVAVYYLRVIRLVMEPLRRAFPREEAIETLGRAIPKLHLMLGETIATRVLEHHEPTSAGGEEAVMEDLPSPAAFNLLQGLCDAMHEAGGSDIWSRAAVKSVKHALANALFPTNGKGEAWKDFDRSFLGHALNAPPASPPSSAFTRSAESYWQRTRLLFGILER